MNHITIKGYYTDTLVAVETYDTDTDAVGGFTVSVPDLWYWLWRCRPCQVRVHGRVYALQCPARHTGQLTLNVCRGVESWRAN
jgi:hypothetical protein